VAFVEGALAASAHRSHVVDYVEARVEPTHVRASAAIPLLFPPVRVTRPAGASGWYVDGGTRLNTPIKPAIDLGAGRVVVIGTGSVIPPVKHPGRHEAPPPDFAVGAQHLLQGALADPLVEDLRRLGEINLFYADADSSPAAVRHRRARGRPPYRRIPYIFIAPRGANAIADLASDVFRERYRGVRALRSPDLVLLNRLLGGAESSHGDLLSYLFFDPEFIRALVTMGKEDARAWLRAPPGPEEPWQVDPLDAFTESGRTPQRKARSRAPRARP
jgi:NTE family protein